MPGPDFGEHVIANLEHHSPMQQEETGPQSPVFVILVGKERVMGFEPTTTCLGSRDSTTELHPQTRLSSVCTQYSAASTSRPVRNMGWATPR
jgi:hypothetical protein